MVRTNNLRTDFFEAAAAPPAALSVARRRRKTFGPFCPFRTDLPLFFPVFRIPNLRSTAVFRVFRIPDLRATAVFRVFRIPTSALTEYRQGHRVGVTMYAGRG